MPQSLSDILIERFLHILFLQQDHVHVSTKSAVQRFPKFFKTGQMLMKMRNTDNKDADWTIELNQRIFTTSQFLNEKWCKGHILVRRQWLASTPISSILPIWERIRSALNHLSAFKPLNHMALEFFADQQRSTRKKKKFKNRTYTPCALRYSQVALIPVLRSSDPSEITFWDESKLIYTFDLFSLHTV